MRVYRAPIRTRNRQNYLSTIVVEYIISVCVSLCVHSIVNASYHGAPENSQHKHVGRDVARSTNARVYVQTIQSRKRSRVSFTH